MFFLAKHFVATCHLFSFNLIKKHGLKEHILIIKKFGTKLN